MITRQASATSFASQGRSTMRSGIARKLDQLLDRLMGGAVFAEPDEVMREDPDAWNIHQRGEPDRGRI